MSKARVTSLDTYLVVAGTEAPANVLVIENLHLKGKVLFQVLDDHHQKRQLNAQGACKP